METVDDLSIQISASASRAINAMDRLISKTNTLSRTMGSLSGNSGITGVANGVSRLAKAMHGMEAVKTVEFSRLARNINKLGAVDTAKLNNVASSMSHLSRSINVINGNAGNTVGLTELAKSISRLGYKSVNEAINNMPRLTTELTKMVNSLANTAPISNNLTRLMGSIATISQNTKRFNSSANQAANGVNKLNGSARNLYTTLVNGLGRGINTVGSKMGHMFANSLRIVREHMTKTQSATTSLAQAIGKFYAAYFLVIRGIRALGSSIKSAMDYIEVLNYFDASFGQVASRAVDNWKAMGYESAQAYYDSFAERAKVLTSQMSGFTIMDNGMLKNTGSKTLGINPTQVMNYQSMYAQMASSMGVASETSLRLSRALTEIGADLASVKNLEFNDVWQDMASGLVGMSRTLDKYGVNIRNVNMQNELTRLGIDANIQKMSQQDKALLRTIILLNSTEYAWADLSDTISQPANQVRLLSSNIKNLSRTIGNIFLPVVAKALPYINGFVIALERLGEKIVELLGFTGFDWGSSGGSNDAISDLLDETDSLTDSLDDADASAKKLKKSIRDFDKLNVISSQDNTNGTGGNGGAGTSDALLAAFDDALTRYQQRWDKGFREMTNSAADFADELEKAFLKAWKTGDGSDIGDAIANWLNKGIKYVNAHSKLFNSGLKKIANILGTGVNGFTEKLDWSGLGKVVGSGIKGALEAETQFFKTVDWTNLGASISKSLNSAIGEGIIQAKLKVSASKLRSAIEFAFGGIKTFSFAGFGVALGQGINDALNEMGKVDKKTGKNGWQMLGESLTGGAVGIADSLIVALKKTDWKKVGQAIADFLTSFDSFSITWHFGTLVSSMLSGLYQSLVSTDNINLASQKISDAINGFVRAMNKKDIKTGKTGWQMAGGIVNSLIQAILQAFANVDWLSVFKGIIQGIGELDLSSQVIILTGLSFKFGVAGTIGSYLAGKIATSVAAEEAAFTGIGTKIGGYIGAGVASAIAGWKIGNWLGRKLFGDNDDLFGNGMSVYDMTFSEQMDYLAEAFLEKINGGESHGSGGGSHFGPSDAYGQYYQDLQNSKKNKTATGYLEDALKLSTSDLQKLWNEQGLKNYTAEQIKSLLLDRKGNVYSFNDLISSSDVKKINSAYQKLKNKKSSTSTTPQGTDPGAKYHVSDFQAWWNLEGAEGITKTVDFVLKATGVDVNKSVAGLAGWLGKINNKNVTAKSTGTDVKGSTLTLGNLIKGIQDKFVTVTGKGTQTTTSNHVGTVTYLKSMWSSFTNIFPKVTATAIYNTVSTFKGLWDSIKSKNVTLTPLFNSGEAVGKITIASLATAFGIKIPAHADGAYVQANKPQLAIIGDNKREGEFVAPESKLRSAVQESMLALSGTGTSDEELALMREQNALLKQIVNKDTSISYKDVFKATRKGNEEYKLINNKSAFA